MAVRDGAEVPGLLAEKLDDQVPLFPVAGDRVDNPVEIEVRHHGLVSLLLHEEAAVGLRRQQAGEGMAGVVVRGHGHSPFSP